MECYPTLSEGFGELGHFEDHIAGQKRKYLVDNLVLKGESLQESYYLIIVLSSHT